ncbi:3-dehydroquinate synthase [Legionella bononiensis]|uniref:3-dehydroquinate synthase n=1 Tax=Legionella bononiensis TaxID=2793102 RepID=A0ABS1W8U0_9GAMM|nr:3-dehydroquinate synthase [Legionella bononiensis]MBL7479825.1 3-dehydroquinate synthase [Legionella bononiensis]MBL7525660.1 3-dehydroquinate synthase [Legionella bononiensis]MBL7561843.1 3-dehydroquinate synthase [Legionella bononiensis]
MAKFEGYTQVDVCLPGYQYPIIICRKGLKDSSLLRHWIPSQQVLVVTNATVAPLYLEFIQSAFASIQCDVVILKDGEEFKNQQSLFTIYDALIQNKHHRDTTVVALGGGVVGDVAGFAASTYQRGVRLIQIPTTLLAQIDASVGGKTAINHSLGKNLIGSFYQPNAVLIDLNTLETLPDREFRSGLAEMIKYSLLEGGDFLYSLLDALKRGLTPKSPELPDLIAHCCQIKADYVEGDEKETGQRALLNLGHTFGHALEAHTHYQRWLHGEAVAIGLYCASVLSYNMGLLDAKIVELVEQMLEYAHLPHKIPKSIDLNQLMDLMNLDKKVKNNCLRFVVIKKPGDCYLDDKVTANCLHNTLITAVEGE